MSSTNPATIPWALDVMLGILIDSAPASEGSPHGIPSLVMDLPAITGKERDAIASALGLIPKGLTSTEEVFDVVAYVNSTLTDNAQVMASVSTRSGTANETYGITRLATTTNGSATYFLNDGRGSVTQTVSQQGKPTSWRSYSAFGEVEASSNLGDLPSYGYNAEEQHPRTGLTYMRFRYYEAKTSTFGVQDTYLGNIFSPLTLNRYLYCLANPVNYTDPSGHVSVGRLTLGVVAVVTNAIMNIRAAVLSAVMPHADKIFGPGSAAKCMRDLALVRAAQERVKRFYCDKAEQIEKDDAAKAAYYRQKKAFAEDYWYIPVASSYSSVAVSSMDGDILLTLVNCGILASDIFASGLIAKGAIKFGSSAINALKNADKASDAAKAADKAADAASEAEKAYKFTNDIKPVKEVKENTLHHIFDNPKHKMDGFVAKYGGDQEKAYRAIEKSAMKYANDYDVKNTADWTRISVDGDEMYATWRTIDGEFKLSNASMRDVLA